MSLYSPCPLFQGSLDAMLQWLLQKHHNEEVLRAGLCTEGALLLLEMLKATMNQVRAIPLISWGGFWWEDKFDFFQQLPLLIISKCYSELLIEEARWVPCDNLVAQWKTQPKCPQWSLHTLARRHLFSIGLHIWVSSLGDLMPSVRGTFLSNCSRSAASGAGRGWKGVSPLKELTSTRTGGPHTWVSCEVETC